MDNYIKAVEEIFGKETYHDYHVAVTTTHFKHKGIAVSLQVFSNYANIFTSKRRAGVMTTEKEFSVYKITEPQLPLAIRAIVRFWAKNGVKLGKEKK